MVVSTHGGSIYTGNFTSSYLSGAWTDERPLNWRQGIAKLYPNGKMPLLALTSKLASEKVDDPQFHWWEEELIGQRVDVTHVYTSYSALTPYSGACSAGDTLYITFTDANYYYTNQFKVGHVVMIARTDVANAKVRGVVTAVTKASSTLGLVTLTMLEADSATANHVCSDTQAIAKNVDALIIGNANPELGERPDALVMRPTKYTNYTQIFRNALSISRTMEKTKLRTGDAYAKAKADALELHGMEMEKALLWGLPYETIGANGQPQRYTMGIDWWINEYNSGGVSDFKTDHADSTWLNGGYNWMNDELEVIFRYGRNSKLGLCGSGALLGLNKLAKDGSTFQMTSATIAYGTKIIEWVTPFGVLNLVTAPLMSYDAIFRNTIYVLEPENIKWRYIDDTFFKADDTERKSDDTGKDGREEEWLTEGGFEFRHAKTMGVMHNVGVDGASIVT